VVELAEDDGHGWILKASAERARAAENHGRTQEVTDAIAERRSHDLIDFLAVIEQREGWPSALDYLRKASEMEYPIPMGAHGYRTRLEPLKYREMLFELFSCTGLEPVSCDTTILLDELEDETSMVAAATRFSKRVEQSAVDQVKSGDTLFFDFSNVLDLGGEAETVLEKTRKTEIETISHLMNGRNTDLGVLWSTETGRRLLSEIGVKGSDAQVINTEVLSVIQSLLESSQKTIDDETSVQFNAQEHKEPSNGLYRLLLHSIIDQDEEKLRSLGSRHALATFNVMLCNSLVSYQTLESSDSYRQLIRSIGNHVVVRAVESIPTIERIARADDTRISTLGIAALGGFYHESAASVLIGIICETTAKELVDASLSALDGIVRKSPEARHLVTQVIHSERPNRLRLRNLYRRMPRGLPDWYYFD
jgi:hypothetical protein